MVEPGAIETYLLEEEAAAERLAARVRLGLIGALFALQLGLLATDVVDVRDAEIGLGAAVVAALYGVGILLVLERLGYRPALSYVSIALDTATITGVTVASGLVPWVISEATKSPYNLLFFLVIATAGLRQAPALPLFAGAIATAGYLVVFAVVLVFQPQHVTSCLACDFSGPDVSPVRVATVAALILLAGVLTSVTARRARELVRRAVSERSAALREQQRREELLGTMERYFPEKEALKLLAEGRDLQAGGERRLVTVLMTDIRGFTMFSERLQPDRSWAS